MSTHAPRVSASVRQPLSVRSAAKAVVLWVLWSWIPKQWCQAISRWTRPVRGWLWATRLRRAVVRAVVGWHAVGAVILIAALPARADTTSGSPENQVFNWMDVKDSHGISVWRYFLSIDEGSARHPTYVGYSMIINIEYEIYRALTGSAIWFITWALSFDWLPMLVAPVRTLGEALTSITGQFNLTTTFLTVTAAVAAIWILRGRWSTGIYELIVSCAIAALAVGVLANPVERIAGADGMIMQARDAGLDLAAGLANKGDTNSSPDELINSIKTSLADTFVRQPTQLINFGRVIDVEPDGARCIEAWNKGHEAAEGNDKDTLKDNIKGCGGESAKQMKDYADHPGAGQVFAAGVLIPGGLVVLLFGVFLAGAMITAACSALGSALKAIPGLLIGILPGAGRGSLFKTAAVLVMSLTIMVFAIVFVVGYMIVVRSFFEADGDNIIKKFLMVDIILIVGLATFRKAIKRLRKVSDTLAQKMAARPGAAPTAISKSTSSANALQNAAHASQVGRQVYRGGKVLATKGASAAKLGGTVASGTAQATGLAASTAATAGAAVLVVAARGAMKGVKAAKNKVDSIGDPVEPTATGGKDGPPKGQPVKDGAAKVASGAAALAATSAGAPKRPRRDDVAKPGIKRPVSSAPSPTRPVKSGPDRGGATNNTHRVGSDKFREYRTASGSPILLPEPKSTRPTRSPASTSPVEVVRGNQRAAR